jgi:hypothetical protein
MRVVVAIIFAVSCPILPAQQPQLFGPPKSGARFTSPTFAETFGASAPALKPPPPATQSCAIPLLSAATNDKANYFIQRVTPKENPDPGMPVAKALPVCGAPADSADVSAPDTSAPKK